MKKFRSNGDIFRNTLRRVMFEISTFVLLAGYFWSDWSRIFPGWLEMSLLVTFATYILLNLAYYPEAKATTQNLSLYLMDNSLGFSSDDEHIRQIPYSDLTISKVAKKNGEVIEVRLKTNFGISIKLQEFENLTEFYECLAASVGHHA